MVLNFVEISSLISLKAPVSVLHESSCPFGLFLEEFKNLKLKKTYFNNALGANMFGQFKDKKYFKSVTTRFF